MRPLPYAHQPKLTGVQEPPRRPLPLIAMIVACLPGCHLVSMVGSVLGLIALRREAREPGHPRDRKRAVRAIWIGFFMGLFNLWMLSEVGSGVVEMVESQTPAAIRASVGPEGDYAGMADALGDDFSVDIIRLQPKGNLGRTLDVALRLSGGEVWCFANATITIEPKPAEPFTLQVEVEELILEPFAK